MQHGLDLRCSKKHVAFRNLTIYYTWKNIRQECKNNKFEIIAPIWNDELELLDGSYSVSDIQDYIKYLTEKHEPLSTNPPIHISINKNNKRLVFKIKDGYKLELQIPETMKLFGGTK